MEPTWAQTMSRYESRHRLLGHHPPAVFGGSRPRVESWRARCPKSCRP